MIKEDIHESYNSDRIINLAKAVKKTLALKKQNKTVGLCLGGFDLLHPGHITHFINAKKYCDILIIGVTSDKFMVRRKKERLVFNEQMRAFSISQIRSVDYVFICDYLTANEVISLLKPTFYIKGPDYKNKDDEEINSERNTIEKVGGRIVYTDDEKLSTTEIIEYIKNLK